MQKPTIVNATRWVGLGLISALLVGHALVFDFVNDDAFISFRYADNLVRHGELVYNLGDRVEGFTNFLWTLLMAGVMALRLDPVPWSKALGILFAVCTLWVLARFSARHCGSSSAWDLLPAVMLAAAPAYACWSTGGLETQLFTFTATLGWTAYLDEHNANEPATDGPPAQSAIGRFPWSGVWFALSALTRPEGVLLFGLAGLHWLSHLLWLERRRPTVRDGLWIIGFVAVFAPYNAWRWWYYGWPFPNTYYVKAGGLSFWGRGWRYFWSWVSTHHLWIVPALAVPRLRMPGGRERRFLLLMALFTVAISVHVIRVGGDFMALHRFLVPVMPCVAMVSALGLRAIVSALVERGRSRSSLAAAALVVAGLLGYHVVHVDRAALEVGSDRGVDSIGWLGMFAGQCTAIGQWLAENAPADASIATTAAGIIPYYSRLHTLDILGLNDEWIAHNVPSRGSRPGHTKSAPESYLIRKEIDFLIYHPTIAERRPGQSSSRRRYWRDRGYEWQSVEVPGLTPKWWGFWRKVRPDKPASP